MLKTQFILLIIFNGKAANCSIVTADCYVCYGYCQVGEGKRKNSILLKCKTFTFISFFQLLKPQK